MKVDDRIMSQTKWTESKERNVYGKDVMSKKGEIKKASRYRLRSRRA
jgi:hypothetical protein